MFRLFLLALLALCLVSLGFANGDISANFNGMIVLENATVNSMFAVTEGFSDMVRKELEVSAHPPSPLMAMVYTVSPHLVIMMNMWSTGAPGEVEMQVDQMNKTYRGWANGNDTVVSGGLNHICVKNIGQQPTLVNYTNSCVLWNELLPPSSAETCWRNLSLTFYTVVTDQPDPRASLQSALCSFLLTDCELITYGQLTKTQIFVNGSLMAVNVMPFTVISANREAALAMLVTYAQFASVLAKQNIIYILADGVQVFFHGVTQRFSVPGTFEQCVRQMWYLIFLIILAPVILIISHRLFHRGRASGKRSIKKSETDIRAGVYVNAASWANFGGSPYLYGPRKGYGGDYGGGGDWMQGDAGYGTPQSALQQFPGQRTQTVLQS
ncbi:hypothetical protein CUR178_04847 [Leishmania enriettii]|uniref:Uncharacterized protein n=1 Tax=Leishmania enriettii TaxID=5663 RepID=A0A836HJU0_LEIEN|nr:hypothetical protein CUR178_04847 [Leishmania enriettii]